MSANPIFFAPLKVPVTDPQTGLMTRDWYLFFQAMFLRVGGSQGTGTDDLQLIADTDDATVNDAQASIADLERAQALDEPQLPTDLSELQALTASFAEDPIIARFTAQWDGLTPASGGGSVKFLCADGTWQVPSYPIVPVGANPAASVGLAAVNGIAATFMRSDGAPALSQSIAPTWTGIHTFGAQVKINAFMTGNAVNGFVVTNSANTRNTFSVSDVAVVNVGNTTDNGAVNFLGTGAATFNGDCKVVGKSGFNNTAPIAKPTATGSRAANAALASLLTALANYGLITDSTTV